MEEIIKEALEKAILPELAEIFAEVNIDSYLGEIDSEDLEDINREELVEESKKALEGSLGPGIKKLASKLILLAKGTADFATRLLSIPLAIIGMGTTGPTISVNLILPLLKQIQGEARNLSQVYDEVDSALEALQIKEMAESSSIISGAYGTIGTLMTTAAIACSLVGVKCGDQEAQEVEVNSPMKVDASECSNYRTDSDHMDTETYPKSAEYCLGFDPVMSLEDFKDTEEKTAQEQYDEWLQENRKCSCCKNYKK